MQLRKAVPSPGRDVTPPSCRRRPHHYRDPGGRRVGVPGSRCEMRAEPDRHFRGVPDTGLGLETGLQFPAIAACNWTKISN